jgi:hypothetical protein
MRAFVIGNGLSRKDFDLYSLKDKGLIIGCNEAYQEFPHFNMMASVDGAITEKIKNEYEGIHTYKQRKEWIIADKGFVLGGGPLATGFNAGQLALKTTIDLLRPDIIYLLGVDFGGGRVFTDKKTLAPSNTGWDTWKELLSNNIIRVGDDLTKEIPLNIISKVVSNVGHLDNECITYREFDERLSIW